MLYPRVMPSFTTLPSPTAAPASSIRLPVSPHPLPLSLESLRGRMVEFTGHEASAVLSYVVDRVAAFQAAGEAVAWVAGTPQTFFPPDSMACGVDLAQLPVIRCDGSLPDIALATDHLMRSEGFSLVVVDLPERRDFRLVHQSRLRALARETHTALLLLTRNIRPDSLASLRARTRRLAAPQAYPGTFRHKLSIVKDKQRNPDRRQQELRSAPDGLR